MKKRDFMRGEFIGLEVEVISSNHPGYIGLKGRIVDETKNTLRIEKNGVEKIIPKAGNEFMFTLNNEKIKIRGDEIQFRPEDRIKKIR
ncbi:MAG: ribonuclease P protein subunit [Methanomassiliicoccales archaeon]|jgi:ribonuclease P protein subunit POP4|nr:ribonuclease P protein subunit [Methanomassiliicoccales archaeon]